jgi:hypothetical protein
MRLRAFLIAFALFASSLCYLYGYFHQTEDRIYTGIRSINASDYSQHLSFIDQCRQGHFFIQNKFTAELQGGDLVRPVYFLLVQPFRFLSLSNSAVFHILRIFCGLALLISLFPILRQYDSDSKQINRAFVLLAFTSGLGLLTRHWIPSADLDIPEAILFVSLGEAPHFLYSLLFLWAGVAAFYAGIPALYFICLLLLWWEHPFEAVILIGVCIANLWALKNRRTRIIVLAVTAGISFAPFLYYQHLKTIPAFSGWGSSQNLMISPPVYSYISAFLPLLVLAFFGVTVLRQRPEKKTLLYFLSIWIVVQFVMAYLPFPFQRRLIAGFQFPLALLGAYGLVKIRKPATVALLVLLFSFTNLWLMKNLIEELRPRQMPYYMSSAYAQAFRWLADHEEKEGVVLSGFITGNLIPGFSGFASYLGHSSLTPEIARKRSGVLNFYQKPGVEFLIKNRIRYIFWGLEERGLSKMDLAEQFQTAFENDQVTILLPRPKIEGMKIVVGGHSRNIGKTSVMAGIIHATQDLNWTAIKITQYGHGICSRNGRSCHCATEDHRFAILEEGNPKGRGDTCRFLAAGAKRSVWVRTKQGMLFEAVPAIQDILKEQPHTILESNSILEFMKPDLYLVVLDFATADFKASAKRFLDRADACIVITPRSGSPAWEGIPPGIWQNKPLFEITPPEYVNQKILDFVRQAV